MGQISLKYEKKFGIFKLSLQLFVNRKKSSLTILRCIYFLPLLVHSHFDDPTSQKRNIFVNFIFDCYRHLRIIFSWQLITRKLHSKMILIYFFAITRLLRMKKI